MTNLISILSKIEINSEEFEEAMLGSVVESRAKTILPEHVLVALIHLSKGIARRRIRQQQIRPKNVKEVLINCIEPEAEIPVYTTIEALADATLSTSLQEVLAQIENQNEKRIEERALLSWISDKVAVETVEDLIEYAQLDWEAFRRGFTEVERFELLIWHRNLDLLVDKNFDKSGRKLISSLQAETKGLGLNEYTVESLFIALLVFEPSLMDLAIRTQLVSKDAFVSSSENLVLEFRNRLRRPRKINDLVSISKHSCTNRLVKIFEEAALIAGNEGRKRISIKDISEALTREEANGRLGDLLKAFGVDLLKVGDFLETYIAEEELEEELIPIAKLQEKIQGKIIGQDHAIERVLPLIKRFRFGYRRPNKPAGVFLFMGPSGTGKTQMAKALAEILYGSQDNMIMLEMGQFGTKETKSMFIGAAPGYVGYGEGKLTNGLRDKPESVVLFDEVEKADPLVLDVLLRFLDEGKIDDPAGPVRDGSKCLIILTSNFLANALTKFEKRISDTSKNAKESLARDLREELLKVGSKEKDKKVNKFFRPEFIFRIDEIILFKSFDYDDYFQIAKLHLESELKYFKSSFGYKVTYDPGILNYMATKCESRKNEGARVVGRLVNTIIVSPIIDFIVAHPDEDRLDIHVGIESAIAEESVSEDTIEIVLKWKE